MVLPLHRGVPERSERSDGELVLAARSGDAQAKELLYRRHHGLAFGLAYRLLGRADEVEDLVQDAFVQALQGLSRLKDPQSFAAWLSSIVVRTARKKIRRKQLARRIGLERTAEPVQIERLLSIQTPPDIAAELRSLYTILEQLPADERVALVLRRVEGLTAVEIADRMGVSLSTAKRRIKAAETLLAARLRLT